MPFSPQLVDSACGKRHHPLGPIDLEQLGRIELQGVEDTAALVSRAVNLAFNHRHQRAAPRRRVLHFGKMRVQAATRTFTNIGGPRGASHPTTGGWEAEGKPSRSRARWGPW
jgi:hypothetical protein